MKALSKCINKSIEKRYKMFWQISRAKKASYPHVIGGYPFYLDLTFVRLPRLKKFTGKFHIKRAYPNPKNIILES